jgi:hypothetical protein
MAQVHDELVGQHKINSEGIAIKQAPRAKRVKG